MEYIEITGKTVEDAITNAAVKLGVSSDRLDYVVIEKGSSGFLGINKKPAIIKVRTIEEIDEFEQVVKDSIPEYKTQEKLSVKEEKPLQKSYSKQQKTQQAQEKPAEVKTESSQQNESVEAFDEPEDTDKQPKKAVAGPNMEPAINKFLKDVLKAMDMEAEVKISIDEPNSTIDVELVGKNMGILIGKRGQTLDSLQYLVNLVANREAEGYFRVKLDTENYRARRRETLESLARNIAYKVKRTKRAVSLEPMNPYERRIIHSALQNDKYVSTKSEGEEPYRHVVVYLKKNV